MLDVLVRKLLRRDDLTVSQREKLNALPMRGRTVAAGDTIVDMGDRQSFSIILLDGFAARMNLLRNGGRQFTELGLPGDFLDLHSLVMKRMDHSVLALTDCRLGLIDHEDLRKLLGNDPHLARLFWLETVVDGAIHRVWLVGLGRQDALGRMAHLFCETYARMEAVDRVIEGRFAFPLSQGELADVLGLSTVHVNRTLMALRGLGLVDWREGHVQIHAFDRLAEIGEFDPLYLRLWKEPV